MIMIVINRIIYIYIYRERERYTHIHIVANGYSTSFPLARAAAPRGAFGGARQGSSQKGLYLEGAALCNRPAALWWAWAFVNT